MRVLAIGSGGVGTSAALIAARRDYVEAWVCADYDESRSRGLADRVADPRFTAIALDASDETAVAEACRSHGITHVLNVVDPRFNMPIFDGAFAAGAHYLDTAMSLSRPHPQRPHSDTFVKLGDEQFDKSDAWAERGLLALCGIGVEPGLADVFARYAADHLFTSIEEIGIRDGANLLVAGYDFAPSFSIWTTIEECLNPPVIWEKDRGWFTTAPFSEPEVFDFPEGIGPVECVNVEHEEVLLVPRWIECERVTFKYGLGDEFIEVLKTLHKLGLDRTDPVDVRGGRVSPRDVVAACLPDPAQLGDKMSGKTCAGTWVTGTGKPGSSAPGSPAWTGINGNRREVYLYHVADNDWPMREYGTQAVTWQTAMNPVIALELLASGTWSGAGVLGPEAFDAVPYLDLMRDGYGQEWGLREQA
ncbi:MAG: saccharopine dehydrogenase family protein [Candidatus Nanopelagicales bacterium]